MFKLVHQQSYSTVADTNNFKKKQKTKKQPIEYQLWLSAKSKLGLGVLLIAWTYFPVHEWATEPASWKLASLLALRAPPSIIKTHQLQSRRKSWELLWPASKHVPGRLTCEQLAVVTDGRCQATRCKHFTKAHGWVSLCHFLVRVSFPQRVKSVCVFFFLSLLSLLFLLRVLFLSSVQSGWPLWIEGRSDSVEKVDWWLIVQPDSARPNWLGCDPVLALRPLIFFPFFYFCPLFLSLSPHLTSVTPAHTCSDAHSM